MRYVATGPAKRRDQGNDRDCRSRSLVDSGNAEGARLEDVRRHGGERVASVLAAAETAANQIREDARSGRPRTFSARRSWKQTSSARRRPPTTWTPVRPSTRLRRSVAARPSRRSGRQLTDSEAQARATRQAAEAMARQIEEEGQRRGKALREESKSVEERLKKALAGLRRMTVEIESCSVPRRRTGRPSPMPSRPYGKGAGDEKRRRRSSRHGRRELTALCALLARASARAR